MAYTNKRKIHIARGTSANLLNGAKFAEDKDRIQNAGQPAFIEDKFYLTVGDRNNKRFDQQVPIRVRTVDGYISDTEDLSNDTFTLSDKKENRYTLTGVKESGTPIVYLNTTDANFDIRRNTTSMLKVDSEKVLINSDKYIQSANVNTTYIKNIDGNSKIEFKPHAISDNTNIGTDVNTTYNIVLKDNTYINSVFTSYNKTNIHGTTNIAGTLNLKAATNLSGTITGTTSGKTLVLNATTGNIQTTSGTIDTLSSTTGTIGNLTSTTANLSTSNIQTLNLFNHMYLPNSTWHLIGDDVYIGDMDKGGQLGILGANGNTGITFVKYSSSQGSIDNLPKANTNGVNYGELTYNGTQFEFSKKVKLPSETSIDGTLKVEVINLTDVT